jgi:flagella synthesis protein FlgN
LDSIETNLIAVLNEQIRCAEAMLSALDAENQALVAGDTELLNSAGADKAKLADALEALETERRGLAAAIESAGSAPKHGAAAPRWQALLELVAACKERNQRNGALVKARTEQVRTALKLLRGPEPQFYDPSGRKPASRSARSLGSA